MDSCSKILDSEVWGHGEMKGIMLSYGEVGFSGRVYSAS
jgi:hypothetical protein